MAGLAAVFGRQKVPTKKKKKRKEKEQEDVEEGCACGRCRRCVAAVLDCPRASCALVSNAADHCCQRCRRGCSICTGYCSLFCRVVVIVVGCAGFFFVMVYMFSNMYNAENSQRPGRHDASQVK